MKRLIKRVLWMAGYELRDREHSNHQVSLAYRLMRDSRANLVVDVGANVGQFALNILAVLPKTRIISFEPLQAAHGIALDHSRFYPNWQVRERVAIGAAPGILKINVAGNSVSSSLLAMAMPHLEAAPSSQYVGQEDVAVETLDRLLNGEIAEAPRIFLKIDTQGYEMPVLIGAREILRHVVALQVELSFVKLYEQQTTGFELITWLENAGFRLYGFAAGGLTSPKTFELLQCDGFFIAVR